jgi:hypothetical protein
VHIISIGQYEGKYDLKDFSDHVVDPIKAVFGGAVTVQSFENGGGYVERSIKGMVPGECE